MTVTLSPPRRAATWWDHRTYPSHLSQVSRVRADLRTDLAGFDPDLTDTVLLCAAELAANAVRYAPDGNEFLRALALVDDHTLWLAITDQGGGTGLPRIPAQRSEDAWATAEGQRGLLLVSALAREWGYYSLGPGNTRLGLGVWAVFAPDPARVPTGLGRLVLTR
ncbi:MULTISPECIES: ATP-binding protein [unclassified Nocardiopsis]|uniref:ATP-binding protein n=1 Tax=unclassified Nocardiopsis TaxID=2649073 RepID=UPI00135A4D4B|nr:MULTISPECIES: ATP-binding protein [unclassified Nocardiopsis]